MNAFGNIIAEAAALPLKDAAWLLWRWRNRLDNDDLDAAMPARTAHLPDLAARQAFMREAHLAMLREQEKAPGAPTLARMQRAFPDVRESDLAAAVAVAIAFDADCSKHFSYGTDLWEDVTRAVARAAEDHPGFSEDTLLGARNYLAYLMK